MSIIVFKTDLGAVVEVELAGTTPAQLRNAALEAQRTFGKFGWISGEIPRGGHHFPLENEPDFDWALLGARPGKLEKDGEEREGVWCRGDFYTRRELEPTKKIKTAAVKYSRGARPTDPREQVEGEEGDFQYVTLAMFRGKGRVEIYAARAERSAPTARTSPRDELRAQVLELGEQIFDLHGEDLEVRVGTAAVKILGLESSQPLDVGQLTTVREAFRSQLNRAQPAA